MQPALETFKSSMARVKALHGLHSVFSKQVTLAIDLSDILRAEVVMCVSALDHFVHEITRLGMLECWSGSRPSTDSFGKYSIPLSSATGLHTPGAAEAILDSHIREKHGYLSFQQPEKIADAVRLFSNVKLWDEVGIILGRDAKSVKSTLQLIVDRRNKIAHEADIDPSYPGILWPIDAQMMDSIFEDVENIVSAIHNIVSRN